MDRNYSVVLVFIGVIVTSVGGQSSTTSPIKTPLSTVMDPANIPLNPTTPKALTLAPTTPHVTDVPSVSFPTTVVQSPPAPEPVSSPILSPPAPTPSKNRTKEKKQVAPAPAQGATAVTNNNSPSPELYSSGHEKDGVEHSKFDKMVVAGIILGLAGFIWL